MRSPYTAGERSVDGVRRAASPIPLTPARRQSYTGEMSATAHLDQLRAAVRYSSGAGRRKITELVAEAAASATAKPVPLRWCAWCGETLAPSVAGEFCNETCEAEYAAAAVRQQQL